MFRERLRQAVSHVGQALHEPEAFAWRWHSEGRPYSAWVFLALGATAALGTTTYGMTMGLFGGVERMLQQGAAYSLAAGLAWSLPLPALYILNSLSGSRLRPSTTLLAALVTTSWGGLALLASIPINLFFSAALPFPAAVLVVNLIVFTGVGVAMVDVFGRVMQRLEPARGRHPAWWLALVGVLGAELFYAFGLFEFIIA